ncbi:Lrp/AsnC family transcriptional regulator [Amycolatopsis endophytica]|uniref:DNA-binding Lrp family transcriptional regulator n=1 Tax=Amycolatopsis endophytica TaxID=860233 RepID=A0A853B441_9PSEU|nr:Lrp/AsnC family transcriptional regulator [Amycolatopsis endophytica]NYI89943.1 DNA-binding Lrp family transcriptional regulator [Amycolatopsis endophytica]
MVSLDSLDRRLIHALQLDGRAPFSRIAAVLGASDRTVARRYLRLRSSGALRVLGLTSARALGQTEWFVRLQCAPDAAAQVAAALARRPDTSWVSLTSGGTEVTCITRTGGRSEAESLLLRKLPRTPRIVGVTAHCLLRVVAGDTGWAGRTSALTADEVAGLRWEAHPDGTGTPLTEADSRMLAVLRSDGRADIPSLAKAAGWSESSTRRRLDRLRHNGLLYFDIDLDALLFGYHTEAILWLTVAPGSLTAVAEALAGHEEIAFAAATTGRSNLFAFAVCRDTEALYDYLANRLGPLPGLTAVETAPVIRRDKRAVLPL